MCLTSCVEVVFVGERSCVLLVCITQVLSGGSLCGKPCVDDLVKIFLCEGGDVELGARTSKHIFVFAFDPLSLTLSLSLSLSLIVHCIILLISFIYLVLIVCHTCVKPRKLHIAPQLLFSGIKRSCLEPFTRNSATLFGYTKCVAFSF